MLRLLSLPCGAPMGAPPSPSALYGSYGKLCSWPADENSQASGVNTQPLGPDNRCEGRIDPTGSRTVRRNVRKHGAQILDLLLVQTSVLGCWGGGSMRHGAGRLQGRGVGSGGLLGSMHEAQGLALGVQVGHGLGLARRAGGAGLAIADGRSVRGAKGIHGGGEEREHESRAVGSGRWVEEDTGCAQLCSGRAQGRKSLGSAPCCAPCCRAQVWSCRARA